MQKEKQVKSYTRRTKSGKTITVRAHTAKYDAAEEVKKAFAKKKGAGEELEDKKSKKAMDLIDELKDLHDKEKNTEVKSANSDWDNAHVEKGDRDFGGGYYIVKGNSQSSIHFRTKAQALAHIKRMQSKSSTNSSQEKVSQEPVKKISTPKESAKTPAKATSKLVKAPANKTTSTKSETKSSSKSQASPEITAADYKAWYHWDKENDPKNKAALKVQKALKAKMGASAYRKYFNEMTDGYSSRGHISAFKKLSAGDGKSVSSKKSQDIKPKR